jgi:hypothetical protein
VRVFFKGLALAAAICLCGSFTAKGNMLSSTPDMGDLLRWGVFSLGGGVADTKTTDDFSGTVDVYGDVGVAGSGNISLSGGTYVHGTLYYRTNGTLKLSGKAKADAYRHDAAADSDLDNGYNEALSSSSTAAGFASSFAYSGLTSLTLSDHQNFTITAQNDRPGNATVLNLTDFTLSGSSTLTLVGDGTGASNFIINVSGKFSLSGTSSIVLTMGVSWDDVLFNITGKGKDITVSGGAMLQGILMGNQRTARISGHSVVTGEIVANEVDLSGGVQVIHPPVTSP